MPRKTRAKIKQLSIQAGKWKHDCVASQEMLNPLANNLKEKTIAAISDPKQKKKEIDKRYRDNKKKNEKTVKEERDNYYKEVLFLRAENNQFRQHGMGQHVQQEYRAEFQASFPKEKVRAEAMKTAAAHPEDIPPDTADDFNTPFDNADDKPFNATPNDEPPNIKANGQQNRKNAEVIGNSSRARKGMRKAGSKSELTNVVTMLAGMVAQREMARVGSMHHISVRLSDVIEDMQKIKELQSDKQLLFWSMDLVTKNPAYGEVYMHLLNNKSKYDWLKHKHKQWLNEKNQMKRMMTLWI